MDDFKKENVKDYTSWDLNCRKILPNDKKKNNLEKKIRRKTRRKMKKDLIFSTALLAVAVLLFLLRFTGISVHIAISIVGVIALVVYTVLTKKEWKIPALEIIMRACYGIALITGPIVMKINDILALQIAHRASAALFGVLLVVLFVHKLIANKKAKN